MNNVATLTKIAAIESAYDTSAKLNAAQLQLAVALSFAQTSSGVTIMRHVLDHAEAGMKALCIRLNALRDEDKAKQALSEFAQISREIKARFAGKGKNAKGEIAAIPRHHVKSEGKKYIVAQGAPAVRTQPEKLITAQDKDQILAQVLESFAIAATATPEKIIAAIRDAATRLHAFDALPTTTAKKKTSALRRAA